jgi:DNA-binding transcriptional MerR regulator
MAGDTLYSIGELARRTGLTVKAIRFYSDRGVVVPARRSPAGYRLYGIDAVPRLELVRTLRDLGVDLQTVRKVVNRELSLREVAFEAICRSMTPVLPENPSSEQLEAWAELAELSQDPDFRALVRRLAEAHVAEREVGAMSPRPDIGAITRDVVSPALESGVEPTSPRADAMVTKLAADYARLVGGIENDELFRRLLDRLKTVADPRRERYLQLLAVINGWPKPESLAPMIGWSTQALEARLG